MKRRLGNKTTLSGKLKNLKDKVYCLNEDNVKSANESSSPKKTKVQEADVIVDVKVKKDTTTDNNDKRKSRLGSDFFNKPCLDLAKKLLGKKLVRKLSTGEILSGAIVETEAYLGGEDKAAHSYNGKKTERNAAMYMDPGTAYVYHIYGMYTCMNISSQGEGAAVLIRAVDPLDGVDKMRENRKSSKKVKGKPVKDKDIGSGPSKLTQALSIDKVSVNQKDLTKWDQMWVEDGEAVPDKDIVTCSRIGVDYAGEWAKKPFRFYVQGNKSVSVRDKNEEKIKAKK